MQSTRRQILKQAGAVAVAQLTSQARPVKFDTAVVRSRLGISLTYFYYTQSNIGLAPQGLRSILHGIAGAGITHVEMSDYDTALPYPPFRLSEPQTMRDLEAACRDAGLKITSFHSTLGSSGRPAILTEIDVAKREIEVIMKMGGGIWLSHIGTDGGFENPKNKAGVEALLREFEKSPITLTVETSSVQDVAECSKFADSIDHPQFGMTIDIGHTTKPYSIEDRKNGKHPFADAGTPTRLIKLAGRRLNHLHLSDFQKSWRTKAWEDHHAPFTGKLRWVELFSALEEIQYEGVFMFEPTEAYESNTMNAVGYFPEMLDAARRRGLQGVNG